MNAHAEAKHVPALVTGGHVSAVIPQSIEEIWRVSTMVVRAGLAPAALVKDKNAEEATSAVATAIMAGAELGLPPMVSLRSFTVIGGRPALYGDGLINVARSSRRAKRIQTGYSVASFEKMAAAGKVEDNEDGRKAFALMSADEKAIGWCVAERSDTGETRTEVFSVADAKRAGLWDEREKVTRYKKGGQGTYQADNDSPWHRYPQRMLSWRAAGYCLRELFADVLGGITDEYEAREIAGYDHEMRDVTPRQSIAAPPPPLEPEEPEVTTVEEEQVEPPTPPEVGDDDQEAQESPAELIARARQMASNCNTGEDFDALVEYFTPEMDSLNHDDQNELQAILDETLDRVQPNLMGV